MGSSGLIRKIFERVVYDYIGYQESRCLDSDEGPGIH